MTRPGGVGRLRRITPILAMLAGVAAWLWPIGFGGRMVVGGDATQFSMGLMASLRDAIRLGRWPLWNDLWGYGFPGLAESQMGVYYPPHLLLYGLLPTEYAYVASLVLHTLWGAMGTAWAARRFGTSTAGAALSGFAWATCGFFLIHLPHQWGYTTGSWMPWAWGLAWASIRGEGRSRRAPCLLAAVLAVQVLPGHFQLAFTTEVGVVLLGLASLRRERRAAVGVLLALAAMLPLAACQLGPTYQLARLSGGDRGFEYLSGFAASPLHLVTYVAPGLFHQSPLWRPLAWDPFHASPEEHLASIGLIPLFLAFGAIRLGWRGDAAVRALLVVAVATTVLSLGPYVPGFSALIRLPGFSFFRAPARWGLASALALALLAGRGFDALPGWIRPGRSLARFALGSSGLIVAVVLVFELALIAAKPGADPRLARGFEAALGRLPWAGEPATPGFTALVAEAYRPQADARVLSALARQGILPPPERPPTWKGERWAIYRQELAGTAVLLGALLVVAAAVSGRPRPLALTLIVLAGAESAWLSRQRPFDLGPIRRLAEQSPVLARLAKEPRGTLSLDPAQNLFQAVGVAPARSYRTLDLPRPDALLAQAGSGKSPEALRAAGIGVRVLGPFEQGNPPDAWADPARAETIRDPALAGWLYGVDLARSAHAEAFAIDVPLDRPARAWRLRAEAKDGDLSGATLAERVSGGSPLPSRAESPERFEVDLDGAPGPVLIARTFDPEWEATWVGPSGERPASVSRAPGGWIWVASAGEPGWTTLRLRYDGRAARAGLLISAIAWLGWVVVFARSGRTSPGPAVGGSA
ncbi:hypothetical protein TA3x_003640 [Tundrisphaera sp. TA3]|uniref:hypothetical protein n=1 Tax=Tundrisphaera sp. TA3 TaxID=3435775 RepID=UPI003EBD1611